MPVPTSLQIKRSSTTNILGLSGHGHPRRRQPHNRTIRHPLAPVLCRFPRLRISARLHDAALPYGQISRLLRLCLGTVVACTAGCNSYGSLVATRFLLGMFESAISPSLILITSMWYKRDEQPKRVGLWYVKLMGGRVLRDSIAHRAPI